MEEPIGKPVFEKHIDGLEMERKKNKEGHAKPGDTSFLERFWIDFYLALRMDGIARDIGVWVGVLGLGAVGYLTSFLSGREKFQ